MAAAAKQCSYLPEELWECIVKFLDGDDDHRTLMSLSVVSNQLLSITNRLRSSLTITNQTIPFLPRVFHRFPQHHIPQSCVILQYNQRRPSVSNLHSSVRHQIAQYLQHRRNAYKWVTSFVQQDEKFDISHLFQY
ncbi:F-box/LRR-repeat protein [Trifolium repens]|jgi:hypothetical protein|nr:F-box/LRR-repeat protein [Trifolium repens]